MTNKQNIYRSAVFWVIIAFIMLLAALEYKLSLVPNSYNFKNAELMARSKNIECLVLGSSHAYFDIKPDELSLKTFNLANTSQSLAQDFSLLEHFIDRLPKLKLVIIPISYFSLEYSALDSPEDWRDCYTFHFLGASEANLRQAVCKPQYFKPFLFVWSGQGREILQNNFAVSYASDTDHNGWYFGNYGSPINSQSAAQRIHITEQSMKSQYIEKNSKCLAEILSLCKKHHISVLFVTTPVHDYYYQKLDKPRWLRTQKIVRALADQI